MFKTQPICVQVGRDRIEQALTYMGQHVALSSRPLYGSGGGGSLSGFAPMSKGRFQSGGDAEHMYRLDIQVHTLHYIHCTTLHYIHYIH
jgi:hypothetical protein